MTTAVEELVGRMLAGDRGALARLISVVENRAPEVWEVMARLDPSTGHAWVLGVTGPPGAGKSTLVDRLIVHLRRRDLRIGVVAVDPSSPFSGGAILGDRIRMHAHVEDAAVFIRSLSTRGRHGGLARAARDVVRLLDAFGCDVVIVETVGVGQTELDIVEVADTTAVVLVPESGDAIQVMKAGLLEIADVFVVNKADRDGADRIAADLRTLVERHGGRTGWKPPVLLTQASGDVGIDDLLATFDRHRAETPAADPARTRHQRREALLDVVDEVVGERLRQALDAPTFADVVGRLDRGAIDPYGAAAEVLADAERLAEVLRARRFDPNGEQ